MKLYSQRKLLILVVLYMFLTSYFLQCEAVPSEPLSSIFKQVNNRCKRGMELC